jgi:hypothetical protein
LEWTNSAVGCPGVNLKCRANIRQQLSSLNQLKPNHYNQAEPIYIRT